MISTTDLLDNRYHLVRLLGQGGMADVYEAIDQRNDTTVAVKLVRAADPDLARRLAQEVRALARVEHRGLVRLLDTGSAGGQTYLVMELVDGPTLAAMLRRGPFGTVRTASLGAQLADALAHVHGQGIVHRDVKPSNILLSADGRARLGDFGIARLLDASTLTIGGTTLGTVAYMSPEQLEDHQVGTSADVWSLGMVLLECLAGCRVYEGTPSEVVARRLAGPVPLPPDLPVPWKLILSGMLDHRPDQRLTCAQVAAILTTLPFRESYEPSNTGETDRSSGPAALDLTALVPGPSATALLVPDATRVVQEATPVASTGTSATSPWTRRWLALLGTIVAAVLVIGLILGLDSNPAGSGHPGASATTKPPPPSTTSTSTTTTTTTTTVSGPASLAALIQDVATGEAAGTIDPGTARAISNQAEQAVTDDAADKPDQATNDLQQAAMAIENGLQNGKITQGEGSTLQTDLSALSAALGLGTASTLPTTGPGPGPGNGNGNGNGNGKGNGKGEGG